MASTVSDSDSAAVAKSVSSRHTFVNQTSDAPPSSVSSHSTFQPSQVCFTIFFIFLCFCTFCGILVLLKMCTLIFVLVNESQ